MAKKLSSSVQSYVTASNAFDSSALAACFKADGSVEDEGHQHRGTAAIKAWSDEVSAKYRATMKALTFAQKGDVTVLTAEVAGNFPGSPIELDYEFTVAGSKISRLRIGV